MFRPSALRQRFLALPLAYRLHALAVPLALSYLIITLYVPDFIHLGQVLMGLAMVGFAAGFIVWAWPVGEKLITHRAGRLLILALHLFVFILATGYARFMVSGALGLPPQDFDLTVALLTLLLYLPAWLLVMTLVFSVAMAALQITWLVTSLLHQHSNRYLKPFLNMLGATMLALLCAALVESVMTHQQRAAPLVKRIAFLLDYQTAHAYPGIPPDARIRLHENGVLSTATYHEGRVVVEVRRYGQ